MMEYRGNPEVSSADDGIQGKPEVSSADDGIQGKPRSIIC
jgi:hypothetical protein